MENDEVSRKSGKQGTGSIRGARECAAREGCETAGAHLDDGGVSVHEHPVVPRFRSPLLRGFSALVHLPHDVVQLRGGEDACAEGEKEVDG